MLQVQRVSLAYGPKVILDAVSFTLGNKEKAGIIGVNGAGKSTLLKMVADVKAPDTGQIMRPQTMGYLAQDIVHEQLPDNAGTVREFLFAATGLDAAEKEFNSLTAQLGEADVDFDAVLERLGDVQTDLDRLGFSEADARAEEIIAGLGLKGVTLDRQVTTLSGGQKTKLAIARILFARPELLLLDEPTNFLDVSATRWLMNFLAGYDRSVLLISHDLELLDSRLDKIIKLNEHTHQLEEYKGTYSAYIKQTEEAAASASKQYTIMRKEIARLSKAEEQARGFGARGVMKVKALARRKAELESTLPDLPASSKKIRALKFPVRRESDRLVLAAEGLEKAYGRHKVLDNISFTVQRGQRLVIMGLNGAGKTTLLKVLRGDTQTDNGEIIVGDKVDVGYYAQENEGLDYERSVLDEARDAVLSGDEKMTRSVLGRFLFSGDKVVQKVGTLSGGEKTRLALAKLVLGGYNLLLLDEPTSHLDVASRQVIGDALAGYNGTIVFVTHDTAFVRQVEPDSVLMMPDGTIESYAPELDQYLALA